MKYLKSKESRRRGVAIELAMMLFLAITAVTIMVVNTSMIQVEKQKQSYNELSKVADNVEKMQINQIANYFISCIKNEYKIYNNDNSVAEDDEFIDGVYCPDADRIAYYLNETFPVLDDQGNNYTYEVSHSGGVVVKEGNEYINYTLDMTVYTITVRFKIVKAVDGKYTVTHSVQMIQFS